MAVIIADGATILSVINGTHLLLSSTDPEADRAFFRDVLKFPFVDAGEGWLIFALPPAELGIHPAEKAAGQPRAGGLAAPTVYLMCDNLDSTLSALTTLGAEHGEIRDAGWGTTTTIRLPGGSDLGLYEPYHRLATSIIEVQRKRRETAP